MITLVTKKLEDGDIKPGHHLVPVKKTKASARKPVEQSLTELSANSPEYMKKIDVAKAMLDCILKVHAGRLISGCRVRSGGQLDPFFKDIAEFELAGDNYLLLAALDELLRLKIQRIKKARRNRCIRVR